MHARNQLMLARFELSVPKTREDHEIGGHGNFTLAYGEADEDSRLGY